MAPNLSSVDLHSHTLFSDGILTPAELVRLARTNGVRTLSVTDHDHVGGIDEALEVGTAAGIEIIPGIELSITHAEFEDIHLLAYYFAWHDPHLQARLESFRVARETRAERILERINAKLVQEEREPIAYDAVKAQVQGAFGRPHIATALIDHGYVAGYEYSLHGVSHPLQRRQILHAGRGGNGARAPGAWVVVGGTPTVHYPGSRATPAGHPGAQGLRTRWRRGLP